MTEQQTFGQAAVCIQLSIIDTVFLDTFSRTTSAPPFALGTADTGQEWHWSDMYSEWTESTTPIYVNGSKLVMPNNPGGWSSYESIQIDVSTDQGEFWADFWIPATDDSGAWYNWLDTNWYIGWGEYDNNNYSIFGNDNWVQVAAERNAWYRIHIIIDGASLINEYVKGRLWKIGETEPNDWIVLQASWPDYSLGDYPASILNFGTPNYEPTQLDNITVINTEYTIYNQSTGYSQAKLNSFDQSQFGQSQAILNQALRTGQALAIIVEIAWWMPDVHDTNELIVLDEVHIGPQDILSFPYFETDNGRYYLGWLRLTFPATATYVSIDGLPVYNFYVALYTGTPDDLIYVDSYSSLSGNYYARIGIHEEYAATAYLNITSPDFPLIVPIYAQGNASFSIDSPIKNTYGQSLAYIWAFDFPQWGQTQVDIFAVDVSQSGQVQTLIAPQIGLLASVYTGGGYYQAESGVLIYTYAEVGPGEPNYNQGAETPPGYLSNDDWGMSWFSYFDTSYLSGDWYFASSTDDGSKTEIWSEDGLTLIGIVDNNYGGGQGNTYLGGIITLKADTIYRFLAKFSQGGGGWNANFFYRKPGEINDSYLTDNNAPWNDKSSPTIRQRYSQTNSLTVYINPDTGAYIWPQIAQVTSYIISRTYAVAQAQVLIFNYAVYSQTQANIKQIYPNSLTGVSGISRVRPISDVDVSPAGMVYSSGTTGWNLVDEEILDTSDYYIASYPSGYISHQFSVPTMPPDVGYNIDSVTITAYIICYAPSFGGIIQVRNPATGTRYNVFGGGQGDVGYYSGTLTTRPWDSQPWAASDINNLQFGDAEGYDYNGYQGYTVRQLYADVSWSYPTNAPFAQAQARITAVVPNFAQVQAYIKSQFAFSQAQAHIKATAYSYGQSLAFIGHQTHSQAQAKLNSFDQPHFGQTIVYIGHFQSSNTLALIRTVDNNRVAITTAQIVHSAGYALTLTGIRKFNINNYGLSRVQIGHWQFGFAVCYIVKKKDFGQAQTDIKRSDNYEFAQAKVYMHEYPSAQTQADIVQTYTVSSNALTLLNTGWGLANTQADILQIYQNSSQASVHIKQTYLAVFQAQTIIRIRYWFSAQAITTLSRQRGVIGQSMAWVGYHKFSQSQAQIVSFNVPKFGLAVGYILAGNIVPGPSSDYQTYLVRFNGHDLPGYAQSESYINDEDIIQYVGPYIDGSKSEEMGLKNIIITIEMLVWERTYQACKDKIRLAATFMRTAKGFAPLYIQRYDKYYLALARSLKVSKTVPESPRILRYTVEWEAKPLQINIDGTSITPPPIIPLPLPVVPPPTPGSIYREVMGLSQAKISSFGACRTGISQARITLTKGFGLSQAFITKKAKFGQAQVRIKSTGHQTYGQTCTIITRKFGWGQTRAFIATLPGAPYNLVAVPGDTIITLSWSPPPYS
jgi:hypothetical protein